MNVFILNSGRCGSTTFIKACEHISNYSAGHETRVDRLNHQRLDYSHNHIEADNRLAWFLGRLDEHYGNDAFYVHLERGIDQTVNSFIKRMDFGIMKAYKEGILMDNTTSTDSSAFAKDYIDTVTSNIQLFLKNKTKKMHFQLENAQDDFVEFFQKINAEGNLELALEEWQIAHNASM